MLFTGLFTGVVCLVFELHVAEGMRAERRMEEDGGNVGDVEQPDFPGMGMNMPAMPPTGSQGLPGMGMNMPATPRMGFQGLPGMGMNMPAMPPTGFQGFPDMGMNMPAMPATGFQGLPGMGMNMPSLPPTGFQGTGMNTMNIPSMGMGMEMPGVEAMSAMGGLFGDLGFPVSAAAKVGTEHPLRPDESGGPEVVPKLSLKFKADVDWSIFPLSSLSSLQGTLWYDLDGQRVRFESPAGMKVIVRLDLLKQVTILPSGEVECKELSEEEKDTYNFGIPPEFAKFKGYQLIRDVDCTMYEINLLAFKVKQWSRIEAPVPVLIDIQTAGGMNVSKMYLFNHDLSAPMLDKDFDIEKYCPTTTATTTTTTTTTTNAVFGEVVNGGTVVFVIDKSGSMGASVTVRSSNRNAYCADKLAEVLNSLSEDTMFNIIWFESSVTLCFKDHDAVKATDDNKKFAIEANRAFRPVRIDQC